MRRVPRLAGAAFALMMTMRPGPGISGTDMISEPQALLQGLDKITGRVSKITAPVGTPVRFGTLSIVVRDCQKNPPEERPESAAFLQIYEIRHGEETKRVFSGWMFASSPALSTLEHPIYDVILLDCTGKAANGSPAKASGSAAGKSAE